MDNINFYERGIQEVRVKIIVKKGNIETIRTEAMVLALFQDEKTLPPNALQVDKKTGGLIREVIENGDFEGKPYQVAVFYSRGMLPAKRILLVGLGKKKEVDLEKIRGAFARALQHLRSLNVREAATAIDVNIPSGEKDRVVQAVVEGALLGLYQYTPYKTVNRDDIKEMRQLTVVADGKDYPLIKTEVGKAQVIAQAVCFVRDLVSAPGNEMTPSILAKKAREVARRKTVSCKVMDRAAMKKIGMKSLLGVAAGSNQEPRFIILEYAGGKKNEAPVVLVGKGLTFDSGGICIKPSEKMDEMKTDMSGGAAVIGALMAAADLQLPVNVVSLVPATENMPGGAALKPGDILKSYSGKTIEVTNTDAEGRLILADALSYASEYKPAAIIDVATLTGACVIALGDEVTGMLGTDEKLKEEIKKAAAATGEPVWELPLWDNYSEMIKSDIADYKNSSGRAAGTITAAAFLSKFVGDFPWVHLDIAGPAWTSKDKPYVPKGASGVAVRLLVEYLRNYKRK
jgi:leucyl aminopeptidase